MFPAAKRLGENRVAVLLKLCDVGFGSGGCLVMRGPNEQFEQNRSQGDALLRQTVVSAAAVVGRFCQDNSRSLQLPQSIGQNVGCNALPRTLELAKRAVAAHHHVANYQ